MWKQFTAACALAVGSSADMLQFPIYDSRQMPNGYADGVNTYV